jgi:hypothetical protein
MLGRPSRLDTFYIFRFQIPPRHFQVVMGLKVHPELRTIPKVQAQSQGGVGRDAPTIIDDFGDTVR